MGSLFGKITEETPKFTLIKKYDNFEIRKYEAINMVYVDGNKR